MVKFNFDDSNAFGGFGKPGGKGPVSSGPKFSVADAKEFALTHKLETIAAGIVLVTVIFLWSFFSLQTPAIDALSAEVQALIDKESPAHDLEKFTKEGSALFATIPAPLPENRFITQLTSLANKRNVTVASFSPPETKEGGFFRRITSQLACSVDGFNDALLFINDIEQSSFALKVDAWKIHPAVVSDQYNAAANNDPYSKYRRSGKKIKLDMVIIVSSTEVLGIDKVNHAP